ncbi:MAG: cobyrinate a,c-diamide synthase [Rhodospirillales bacterium]
MSVPVRQPSHDPGNGRGVIVAAPASGSGKTIFTLALIRHLARSGVAVASAKVGPDYIDPAFHAAAGGTACVNLDPWAMRAATLDRLVGALSARAGIVVCEGVMGLFDGAVGDAGSTADLAARTGWPVILVLDVRAQAASAAAVLRGFASHRADVDVAGVVFNRVGSPRHLAMVEDACRRAVPHVGRLGGLGRMADLELPERHLGLVQAAEHPGLAAFLDAAADRLADAIAVDRLLALARPANPAFVSDGTGNHAPPIAPLGQRIAVADDPAFAFRYPHVIEGWRAAGASLSFFSPLADEAPDAHADAVYLPGGYPELHAGRLAGNARFLAGLTAAAGRGAAIVGECGGYMVMGEALIDAAGEAHRMARLLPLVTSFAERRLHLGYRRARLEVATALGAAGSAFRGHEFHFARTVSEGPGQPLFRVADAEGRPLGGTGLARGRVVGSFVHLIDRAEADG